MNRRVAGRLLVVAILAASAAALPQPAPPTAITWVPVPGGIAAIARLLGPLDQDPASFVLSLNELLLSATHTAHDWQAVPLRYDLVRYLAVVGELRERFPGPITIGAGETERRALERLAGALGFSLAHDRRLGYHLVPRNEGERDGDQAFRRTIAQALGLQLETLTAGLNDGETASVDIPMGRAAAPLPPEMWQALTGRPLDEDALATLARDQRLSLLIEGRRRLSVETRRAFDRMDVRRFYRDAPFSVRRYASSLRIRDGRMVVPGGEDALPVWSRLIGAAPDSPPAFLDQLLRTRHAKGAYVWQSFDHAPPPTVEHYLHRGSVDQRVRLVGEVLAQLEGASSSAFDGALVGELGFAAFARSVPITGNPSRLDLPGGPGLWSAAIDGDLPPATLDELAAAVRRGSARELDDEELLLRVLRAKTDRPGPDREALPRLVRGANLFRQHPALYSPETVVLVARSSDLAAPALQALDVIALRDPEVARDYLLTVSRLLRLDLDWTREQLVMSFQGGVEWLRSMAAAGVVDAAVLERQLESWSAIHLRHDDAAAAAAEQLAWIAALLRQLPAAPDLAPGRGPLERAMLQALIPSTEPSFTWRGLSYDSDRPAKLAARMADSFEFFGVPSADQLASFHDTLGQLARGCREEDLDGARRAAAALRNQIAALPSSRPPTADRDPELARRLDHADRDQLLSLAGEILRRKKAKGLAGLAPRVEASARHLAAELRPFLLAPAYLVVLAADRGSLLQDRDLVRKHRLVPTTLLRQRAWSEATVERDDQGDLGSWICGHVGTVDAAIASFTLSGTELRAVKGLDQRRTRTWYHHWATTPWHRLAPPVNTAIARILALGESVVDLARREAAGPGAGPHLELVATLIPFARLEAAALRPEAAVLSPGEALMVGLAAIELPDAGATLAGVDAATLAAARAAIAPLGADWRQRLELAGPATPSLDGKASPGLGWWPSYEAVEFDRFTEALVERELVDLHLLVIDYLGRHGLPGVIGSDLMRRTMENLASTLELGHDRDWTAVLRGLLRIDDAFFDARLRECLREDLYRLRDS